MEFYTGVPDSLLQDICAYITDNASPSQHIIAANEGGAIALATGYHLSTGKIGLVYMQNSGLGNAVNPLVSLADPLVYSIPMLLLIGWRGEPGIKDEPQHAKQGLITLQLLETLGIKYIILSFKANQAHKAIGQAFKHMRQNNEPFALIVRKNTFMSYQAEVDKTNRYSFTRETAISTVLSHLASKDVVVATTGKISREIYEYREKINEGHQRDFLCVGSMGHASQIALGIALRKPDRYVYCFDGDGALIMHMGALAINGTSLLSNYRHIVFNNGAHDSVGGQPTVGFQIDICSVAENCGYKTVLKAETKEELVNHLRNSDFHDGPLFLEVLVRQGARTDLGRPTTSPVDNKKNFMEFILQ